MVKLSNNEFCWSSIYNETKYFILKTPCKSTTIQSVLQNYVFTRIFVTDSFPSKHLYSMMLFFFLRRKDKENMSCRRQPREGEK